MMAEGDTFQRRYHKTTIGAWSSVSPSCAVGRVGEGGRPVWVVGGLWLVSGRAGSAVGAVFGSPGSVVCGGFRWTAGCVSAELRESVDAFERGDELAGPGPGVGEAAVAASAGGGDRTGGVEQAVAQPFWLSAGEVIAG